MTTTFYPSLNSLGVIPVSHLKNLEKNEGLGKFIDSAICQTGRSLYFSCSLACPPDQFDVKATKEGTVFFAHNRPVVLQNALLFMVHTIEL